MKLLFKPLLFAPNSFAGSNFTGEGSLDTSDMTTEEVMANAIVTLTAELKPNYSIDGQSVNWADNLDVLLANLKTMREMDSEIGELVSGGR